MLSFVSHSPQCPTQSCYSGNTEAKQQLQHQRFMGASTQPDAEWHHPGVQGKHNFNSFTQRLHSMYKSIEMIYKHTPVTEMICRRNSLLTVYVS